MLSENANLTLSKRYLKRSKEGHIIETPEQLFQRVAGYVCQVEKEEERHEHYEAYHNMLSNLRFLPNSPCLMNAGLDKINQLFACFVIPTADSIEAIMKTNTELAYITKYTGGVGINISTIRPAGDIIESLGIPSKGWEPWLKMFNNTIANIGQGRRTGALMIVADISHPNIEWFISCKDEDETLNNMNISVLITDDFMQAVEEDSDFDLIFEDKVYKTIKAKELFSKIVYQAWKNGEPGVIFIDEVNKKHPIDEIIRSSNPCQPANATVLTQHGISTIGNINVGDKIWDGHDWTQVINKINRGKKPVYRYDTSVGYFLGTQEHKIIQKGFKIEVKNAKSIDRICGPSPKMWVINPIDIMDGLVFGDGSRHKESEYQVYLDVGEKDQDYFEDNDIKSLFIGKHDAKDERGWKVETTLTFDELEHLPERVIPDRFMYADVGTKIGFLRGLFSANGSICGDRVTLKTSCQTTAFQVRTMLNSIGIYSYITINKAKKIKWHNGDYMSKKSYTVNITTEREFFYSKIGFIQKYKMTKLKKVIDSEGKLCRKRSQSFKITNIDYIGSIEVFDITVDNSSHTYWSDGLNVSNCGESMLLPYEACDLGSINLSAYCTLSEDKWGNPKSYKNYNDCINWDLLGTDTRYAVTFLDALIDLTAYPIQQIEEVCKKNRKIGLGVMGVAELLYKLGVGYGTRKGRNIIDSIYKFILESAEHQTMDLGAKKGPFPNNNVKPEYLKKGFNERRNSVLTVQAPTGSISIIANTTSGIEPLFALSFKKNVLDNEELIETNKVFQIYCENKFGKEEAEAIIKTIIEEYDGSIAKSPAFSNTEKKIFVTAKDLDYKSHVDMQIVVQKYVENSVSKTINLPNHATVEDVENAYLRAYNGNCKGITVYRDGSRKKQVLQSSGTYNKNDEEVIVKPIMKDRPEILDSKSHRVKTACGHLYINVGLDPITNEPFEVIANMGKHGTCVNSFLEGLCRQISINLRYGVDLSMIIRQLMDIRCGNKVEELKKDKPLSCVDAVGKILSKYVIEKKNTKSKTKNINGCCPKCGGALIYEEGCSRCIDCSYSHCG